ncbi:MAG: hypothetical protein ABSC06_32025 [Rhodopila sp.]|jgi:hypothetical protein
MRENHDAFKQRLETRFPDWRVMTDLFGEAGLTDRYGNKPKPESARKLWQRIKREVAAERSKPKTAAAVQKPPPPTRAAQSSVQPKPAAASQDMSEIRALLSPGRALPDPIK